MTYKELKIYFESNPLPDQLETKTIYLPNLPFTVKLLIEQIDASLKNGGPSDHAKRQKDKLNEIFNELIK